MVGQDPVVQTLRNALRSDHVAHAYLFSGPRGCGKTTSARLVAKALNCLHADPAQRPDNTCAHCAAVAEGRFLDLIEIDGASNNSVDNIRELREKINFAPGEGRYKVYIIDEVHMLSMGAFNALLKTLEEPPPHAVFILATTEVHKIPPTVASRCQRFEFRRIPVADMVARLRAMCAQEGLEVEEAALELVARQATGSLRDAISLLDQLVGAGGSVTLAQAQELLGASASQSVQQLVEAVAARDLTAGLAVINAAIDAGADTRQLARQVVDYLRGVMLVRLGNAALVEASAEARAAMARLAQQLDVPALLRAIRAFNTAANDARGGWQPQLPLELAVVEAVAAYPAAEEAAAGAQPQPAPAAPSVGQPAETAPPPAAPGAVDNRPPPPAAPAREARAERPARRGSPAPAGESAASGGSGAGQGGGALRAEWQRILGLVRERDKATEALLRSCSVVGLSDNVLRLATHEFAYDKISANAEALELVQAAVTEVFGTACVVRLEVSGRQKRGRPQDIPQDGMVATALDLGGEIVE